MDAFYASVEQRDNPDLRGKPVVVGGGQNRGVVAAASYEARTFGVRSAMPMREARRRCPELLRVKPRMSHYQSVSKQIFDIFRTFTPHVEGLSLDEAFLDVSGSQKLLGEAADIARQIKDRISASTALTASVGVAHNKLVAKIASDLDKPDGLTIVTAENCRETLDPLPVAVIPGIGKKTLAVLQSVNIHTVADLRVAELSVLTPIFGRFAAKTRDRAAGIDDRPVVSDRAEKSISAEETFDNDLRDRRAMERELLHLSERTCQRLRKAGLGCATVQIKVRQPDFTTFTRQQRLQPPGNGTDQIYAIACRLLGNWLAEHPDTAVRLLGVGATELAPATQADLFASDPEDPASAADTIVDSTMDRIRERFGDMAVGRASTLEKPASPSPGGPDRTPK